MYATSVGSAFTNLTTTEPSHVTPTVQSKIAIHATSQPNVQPATKVTFLLTKVKNVNLPLKYLAIVQTILSASSVTLPTVLSVIMAIL